MLRQSVKWFKATLETWAVYKYERSTTRSRREANKPRFVHYSKWIDVVPDKEGNPEYRVHFKTKVLTVEEKFAKLERRKWFRKELDEMDAQIGRAHV